jgi:hypothetical protein
MLGPFFTTGIYIPMTGIGPSFFCRYLSKRVPHSEREKMADKNCCKICIMVYSNCCNKYISLLTATAVK